MNKNTYHSFVLGFFTLFLISNTPVLSQNLQQADRYFKGGAYYGAAELYQAELNEKDSSDYAYRQYRIGECYRKMNFPEIALGYYSTALLYGYAKPAIFSSLGEVYLTLGSIDEALSMFQTVQTADPDNVLYGNRILSCGIVFNNNNITPNRTVYPITSLNTKGSEYGVFFWHNRLIYSSTGEKVSDIQDISQRTGLGYSKISIAEYDGKGFSPLHTLDGIDKPESNEGTFSYDPISGKIYGSRCEADQRHCYIFEATVKGDRYREKGKLQIGRNIYGIGHPFITPDGERIYFTSTMKGGFGAADIWYVQRKSKNKWSDPINCGSSVNTPGNEVFPFVVDDRLYFTSDGLPGFGGLDIFMARIQDSNSFKDPVNLGKPFNTGYDDLNLVISEDKTKTLFVSNRENILQSDDIYGYDGIPTPVVVRGKVISEQDQRPLPHAVVPLLQNDGSIGTISLDHNANFTIYADLSDSTYTLHASHDGFQTITRTINIDSLWKSAQQHPDDTIIIALPEIEAISISGITYNQRTNEIIPNVKVLLLRNDTVLDETISDSHARYSFPINIKGLEYRVEATQSGYKTGTRSIVIPNKQGNFEYCKQNGHNMNIPLMKIEVGVEITIKDIYYEFDQSRLLDISKKELNFLIELMNEYPDMLIKIASHTDSRGSLSYNDKLSERRAKSVVNYLVENNISPSRFTWQGYGKRQLVIPDAQTEEEHQMNRRTTFTILSLGAHNEPIRVKTISAKDRIKENALDVMAYRKNFWIQVDASMHVQNLDAPLFRRVTKITGKVVQLRYENDGMKRYYVGPYDTKDAAKQDKKLLREEKIQCIVKQFDK